MNINYIYHACVSNPHLSTIGIIFRNILEFEPYPLALPHDAFGYFGQYSICLQIKSVKDKKNNLSSTYHDDKADQDDVVHCKAAEAW